MVLTPTNATLACFGAALTALIKVSAEVQRQDYILIMDTNLPFVPGKNPFDIHVYFKPEDAAIAATLNTRLLARFGWLKMGRWNDRASLLSPHPLPMFETFAGEPKNIGKVNEVIEWLDGNRGSLSVLIHPNTTDGNVQDHSVHAVWLGQPVALRFWLFHAVTAIKAVLVLASAAVIWAYVL